LHANRLATIILIEPSNWEKEEVLKKGVKTLASGRGSSNPGGITIAKAVSEPFPE
jgi:hypothetical protein